MTTKMKFAALVVALAMFAGAAAPASAVTIAELQAQIEALMAQLAALQGGSVTTGTTFTQNLTVGSTGADVTSLQQYLVAGGYLNMPAGVAYGYFGPLTKTAVAAWQAAHNVSPAVGYWGPISRAAANATSGTTTTTPGSTVGISTPGVEGTITASKNPSPASGVKLYEGASKTAVFGLKLEAKLSDVRVERVKIQIPSTTFYNKIADRLYVMDGSSVLASTDLNADTVVKEGSNYYITVAGFNFVVPVDSTKVLTIALDAKASWDSGYDSTSYSLTVPVDGVRGTDGAGINQYSPSSTFSNSLTATGDLADSATLAVSLNSASPVAGDVIAAQGSSENEYDGLELVRFDLKAEKDSVKVTDLVAGITRGGTTTTATATTAYLYEGSTLIGSATVVGTTASAMTATFSDIDYTIAKDTTKTLSLKVDIDSAGTAYTSFLGTVASTNITDENSTGASVTDSGTATGETLNIRNAGPEFSLVSSSIAYTAPAAIAGATSTAHASFVIRAKAVGSDVYFGTQVASTTLVFQTYAAGAAAAKLVASSTSFTVPTSGVTISGLATGQAFKLSENNSVDIPADFIFESRTAAGVNVSTAAYAVGVESIAWSATGADSQTSTFMAGKTSWRTSTITMP